MPSSSLSVDIVPVLLKFSIIPKLLIVCQLDLIEPELLSSVILPQTFTHIAALLSVGSGISLVCFKVPVLVKTFICPQFAPAPVLLTILIPLLPDMVPLFSNNSTVEFLPTRITVVDLVSINDPLFITVVPALPLFILSGFFPSKSVTVIPELIVIVFSSLSRTNIAVQSFEAVKLSLV